MQEYRSLLSQLFQPCFMEQKYRYVDASTIEQDWFLDMPSDYRLLYLMIYLTCDNASGIWRPKKRAVQNMIDKRIDLADFIQMVNRDDNGKPFSRIIVCDSGNWILMEKLISTMGTVFSASNAKIGALKKLVNNDIFPSNLPQIDWGGLQNIENQEIKFLLLENSRARLSEVLTNSRGTPQHYTTLHYSSKTNNIDSLESKNTIGVLHSEGGDSQGEGGKPPLKPIPPSVNIPARTTQECLVQMDKNNRNPILLPVQRVYELEYEQIGNLSKYPFLELRKESFEQWKVFVDLVVGKEGYSVLFNADRFINPMDFQRLLLEHQFSRDTWETVIDMMLSSPQAVVNSTQLYFRIKQFIEYTRKNIKTTGRSTATKVMQINTTEEVYAKQKKW